VVEAPDEGGARAQVAEMAERFLSNPVIEDYRIVDLQALTAAGDGR
jgi:phosphoribosylformylglycinamidine (FGAM) synthase PurS component